MPGNPHEKGLKRALRVFRAKEGRTIGEPGLGTGVDLQGWPESLVAFKNHGFNQLASERQKKATGFSQQLEEPGIRHTDAVSTVKRGRATKGGHSIASKELGMS